MGEILEADLTGSIIGVFYQVYSSLGFGFLESVYIRAMEHELKGRSHEVRREAPVRLTYKGIAVGAHRVDMIVDQKVIVEVKSTYLLHPTAERQLLNYLRGTGLRVGLLLHFGPEPKFYRRIWTLD